MDSEPSGNDLRGQVATCPSERRLLRTEPVEHVLGVQPKCCPLSGIDLIGGDIGHHGVHPADSFSKTAQAACGSAIPQIGRTVREASRAASCGVVPSDRSKHLCPAVLHQVFFIVEREAEEATEPRCAIGNSSSDRRILADGLDVGVGMEGRSRV